MDFHPTPPHPTWVRVALGQLHRAHYHVVPVLPAQYMSNQTYNLIASQHEACSHGIAFCLAGCV